MTLKSFFLSRWRGEAPLPVVFWRDMIAVGTAVNIVAAMTALILLAAEMTTAIVLAVYFAPLPWNLFLFFSVWRSAENAPGSAASLAKAAAAVWVVIMTAL